MKWGETAHCGGFNWKKSPARKSPECVLCLSGGKSEFYLGVGVSWAWSGDKVLLRFHSCGWLLRCQMWDAGNRVLQKYILIPICTPNKYAGRAQVQVTNVTCCIGVDCFQGVSSATQRKISTGHAPVHFHGPGWWRFWQCLVLADGLAPHWPTFPLKDWDHPNSLPLPHHHILSHGSGCFCLFVSLHLGGRSYSSTDFSFDLPK